MKKKVSLLLIAIVLILLVIFLINKSEQKKMPTLVNLSDTTYVLTKEPYEEEALKTDKVYVVQKKVDRYSYPKNNLESNFLDEGTEIYLPKEETESIICYKLDENIYVARENMDKNLQE